MKKHKKTLLIPCAAAALTLGTSMLSFAATGWQEEDGTWRYYDKDGEAVTSVWRKSGNDFFWLDEDGDMATDQLVEDNDNYYYVNESGAMVKNQWRELENEDKQDDDDSDTAWYYFGADGKAYKAKDSGKVNFKSIVRADGVTKKYAFDEQGKMLYGWIDEQGERQTEDDAWQTGVYYLGAANDGAMRSHQWERLDVVDDDQTNDEFQDWYWFYFNANGKKAADTKKTINGRKYYFEEYGNARFSWYASSSNAASVATPSFYSPVSDSWLSVGWFKTVPGENTDPDGYADGEERWYYAEKDGDVVKSRIKKINGSYYAFDEYGKMLEGLYKLTVSGNDILTCTEVESESNLPEAGDPEELYYFGGTSKDGAMKTGTVTLDIDGERHTYNFRKSGDERGQGYNGIEDGVIYEKGKRIEADKDEKLKKVDWNDPDDSSKDGTYLVNISGKIQKNKKNAKDGDDRYYCTDSKGMVTYEGTEKYSAN